MTPLLALCLMSVCAAADLDTARTAVYSIETGLVLKPADQKSANRAVLRTVNDMNGWFLNATAQEIVLRLPQDSVAKFLAAVDTLGLTVDETYRRTDQSSEYYQLVAGVQAKEFLLKQYMQILDSSGATGIYAVSKGIADLQQNIELQKGRLRAMIERMEYAEVRISFQFVDRRAPAVTGQSDFYWINTVDLPSLIEDFR